jgi:hypothetical protein
MRTEGLLTKHGPGQQTALKCLGLNAQNALKLTCADHLDLCNNLLASMNTTNVRRKNERINRRKGEPSDTRYTYMGSRDIDITV